MRAILFIIISLISLPVWADCASVYRYDRATGELLGSETPQESPLEPGVCLLPADTTLVAPPAPDTGKVARWTGSGWEQVEDHRGEKVYSTNDGHEIEVKDLGALPADTTSEEKPGEYYKWQDGAWVEDLSLAPVPNLSPRQLFICLKDYKFITPEEAVAAAQTGEVPAAVQAEFDKLTDEQRVDAEITWAKMSVVERHNPLAEAIIAAGGLTDAQADAFFRDCATK